MSRHSHYPAARALGANKGLLSHLLAATPTQTDKSSLTSHWLLEIFPQNQTTNLICMIITEEISFIRKKNQTTDRKENGDAQRDSSPHALPEVSRSWLPLGVSSQYKAHCLGSRPPYWQASPCSFPAITNMAERRGTHCCLFSPAVCIQIFPLEPWISSSTSAKATRKK